MIMNQLDDANCISKSNEGRKKTPKFNYRRSPRSNGPWKAQSGCWAIGGRSSCDVESVVGIVIVIDYQDLLCKEGGSST